VSERRELPHLQSKERRVPPHDRCSVRLQHLQTRPNRACRRPPALWSAREDALLAESRASGRGRRISTRAFRRVQHGVEHLEPALPTDRSTILRGMMGPYAPVKLAENGSSHPRRPVSLGELRLPSFTGAPPFPALRRRC
jgi:hypothetical protein